jgi:hypothetical protein
VPSNPPPASDIGTGSSTSTQPSKPPLR